MAIQYNFGQLKSIAMHAIGKAQPASGATLDQIVNRALEFMTTYHGWSWRVGAPIYLSAASNTATINLPSDFGEMLGLVGANSWKQKRLRPVRMLDLQLIEQFPTELAAHPQGKNFIGYHVISASQGTATNTATRQLLIAPTPTNTATNVLSLTYFRLLPALVNDTDVADMPPGFFDPFFQLCRCFGLSTEEIAAGETAPTWELATRQLDVAKAFDAMAMPADLKGLQNVVDDYYGSVGFLRPFDSAP